MDFKIIGFEDVDGIRLVQDRNHYENFCRGGNELSDSIK
jgi:hypothetical protein